MTLDSAKGTSLGVEPSPDSSKRDPSKMAEAEKSLDDLIVSLKAKLVRSRKNEKKPPVSNRNERHILSEKYAVSRDRHHRSRDTRLLCHVRNAERSHDRKSDWSSDYWRGSDSSCDRSRVILSRDRPFDTLNDVKMTQRNVSRISDGDCSTNADVKDRHLKSLKQKMSDFRRSVAAKDDFNEKTKLEKREVDTIIKIETPEMRKSKQNQKSSFIREYMPCAEQILGLNCSGQRNGNGNHLLTVNKMLLSAVNKLQRQPVGKHSSQTKPNYNLRPTDVLKNDSRCQKRRKKKRKFLQNIYKDVPKMRRPAAKLRSESPSDDESRGADRSSQQRPSSVDEDVAEVMRLKADRLRLDRFRGGLKLYASAVMEAQSRLQGLIQDLSIASPSTLLGDGDGSPRATGEAAPCDRCCNYDVNELVADSYDRCNIGDNNDEHDRYGNDDDGDHGDEEVGNGRHHDNETGNSDHGDCDDRTGVHGVDGDGNGSHGHDKYEIGTHGDISWGQRNDGDSRDGNSVGEAYYDNYGDAKDCNGCRGDFNGKNDDLSESNADQLRLQRKTKIEEMEADTEVALTNDASSPLTPVLELSAPALVLQSLMPDSLDSSKPDPPSPPVLKSIQELYGNSDNCDKVHPLTVKLHPVTWWPHSGAFVPISSVAVKSEIPPESIVDRLCAETLQTDDSDRPLEANYSSPDSKEHLVNFSSLVSKEPLVRHSSLDSKEQLLKHGDLEQIQSISVIKEQFKEKIDPEPINSSPGPKEQLVSKTEESFSLEPSFPTGNVEKREKQDDSRVLSLGENLDSESIRARYAKATSAFSKLTSILSDRRKSKLVVDARLELLRRELYRLKFNFFMENSKLSEEAKSGFSRDYGSTDVYLEAACDISKLDASYRHGNGINSSYSHSASEKHPEKSAKITQTAEETSVRMLSTLNRGQSNDTMNFRSGLSPEFLAAGESAVDLTTKVHRKPESDAKSDRQLIQDVGWLELGESAGTAVPPVSRHNVRGTHNGDSKEGEGRRDGDSWRLKDVSLKDFDAIGPNESPDVGEDCQGRVLNLASAKRPDNGHVPLWPKKRLRQKYRDQTEQERADGTTRQGMVPGMHCVQETILDPPPQLDYVEYPRCLEQLYREFALPSRDFQTCQLASPPAGSLPAATISNRNIALAAPHFREAGKRGFPEQKEKVGPFNGASEEARKRRMVEKDHCQPVLSHQHKTRSMNDYPNKESDVNYSRSHGNGITAYPSANTNNSFMAHHNSRLTAKQMTNNIANQPPCMSSPLGVQRSINQGQMDSTLFLPSKSIAEFQNSGRIPLEMRSGATQWSATDSNKPSEYGPAIALDFPPGAYSSPAGCALPVYSFTSDTRNQSYPTCWANRSFESSAVDRRRSRRLDFERPIPEHLLFSNVRVHPENRNHLFSMGGSSQLFSSAEALMSPNGVPGFYRIPNESRYGESAISPEFYMTTKNPY